MRETGGGIVVERELNEAAAKAMDVAISFSTALAISSGGMFLWRYVRFEPISVSGLIRESKATVNFRDTNPAFEAVEDLHSGMLAGALDLYGGLHVSGWAGFFYTLYQKAECLAASPIGYLGSFHDEAYLNYFRCLEYVVMDRIVQKRGQFTPHYLADSFQALGIDVQLEKEGLTTGGRQSAIKLGSNLIQQRGRLVAHLGKGVVPNVVPLSDVINVKRIICLLIRAYEITRKGKQA
jgi:hypothetical protein